MMSAMEPSLLPKGMSSLDQGESELKRAWSAIKQKHRSRLDSSYTSCTKRVLPLLCWQKK